MKTMSKKMNPDLEAWLDEWSSKIDEWEKQTGKNFIDGGKLTVSYPLNLLDKVKPYATHLLTLGIGITIGFLVL